jgi:polyhydroxyalkanoate synthesis regulator phasin
MAEPASNGRLVDLVQRLGRDEARALADELGALWRGESTVGERASARLETIFRELGLVTRAELEEAQLKIAQLEHRLRLLEKPPPPMG